MRESSHLIYEFGEFQLEPDERRLMHDGKPVPLTPKAFDTLVMLVERAGHLVEKEELISGLWPDSFVEEANVAQHVWTIRKTLGEADHGGPFIETVPKKGFRFTAPVVRKSRLDKESPVSAKAIKGATTAATTTNSASSAEYIVTGIRQHKRAAALIGVGIIVVSAVVLYALSRRRPGTKEALKNATFTQLTDQAGPEYFPSLAPDGKSFVYASHAGGNWDIYLQRVGGKNPINLTKDSTANDTQPAFSPDGELIAFRSEREGGGIFLMGATGESVKRLSDAGFNPAWSPDGKEIACADEGVLGPVSRGNPNSRVWAFNVSTGEKRQITKVDAVEPNWSPHGYRIAYQGRRNFTQRDVWTIPANGGEPLEVTNDPAMDWNPVWSPDGNYLYFVSDRGGSMNLWRVPIEEKTGKVLGPPEAITTPSPSVAHLSFSRDGHRLAYGSVVRRGNLQRVGFDPVREAVLGQPVWVTQGSRGAVTPDVSADSEWLTFAQIDKQENIFVVKQDGTGLRQLTDDIYKDREPRWSPDGKRIVFYSDRTGKWEVWMINADGSGLKQITYAQERAVYPVWAPDGTRLAYDDGGTGRAAIIEVGKSWQEQTALTLPAMKESGEHLAVWSWSPDGRKLVGNRASSSSGVMVYSLESQQYEQLTDFGRNPVWLSDSRRILFDDHSRLYLLDSLSKKFHEVLSVAPNEFGIHVALPRDDRMIYFSLLTAESDIWLMTLQ